MALSEFLSAVRVLIMDMDALPETVEERREQYSKLFPSLSVDEVSDLSKVPPEKFRQYTSTIFYGERGMVSNHLPISLKVMQESWQEVFGRPFRLYSVIKELHRAFPWKSNRTIEFVKNFERYVNSEELTSLVEREPSLPDLVRLEMAALRIKRFPDEELSSRDSLAREKIAALTVEELLSLHCCVPESAEFLEFNYDVVSTLSYFRANGRQLPEEIKRRRVWAAGGRARSLFPGFVEISEKEKAFLSSLPRKIPMTLEELAGGVVSQEEGESEEEVFARFLELVVSLGDVGAVIAFRDDGGANSR
jgi:hypothetical protein